MLTHKISIRNEKPAVYQTVDGAARFGRRATQWLQNFPAKFAEWRETSGAERREFSDAERRENFGG